MAILLAKVGAAFERLATSLATTRICEPAGHIFHHPLAAQTLLLRQKWALRA